MGVKISSKAEPDEGTPTFESTEAPAEKPSKPAKKKSQVTKPDIEIPPEFEPTDPYGDWRPMSKAPKDRSILVACHYEQQPHKWFYWEVKWFDGPLGAGFYIVGTQWHMLNPEIIEGWIEGVGHP